MDSLPANCLRLSLVNNASLRALVKELQPGDELKLTLKGTTEVELVFTIDELLPDVVSGQLKDPEEDELALPADGDVSGGSETNPQAMPGDGVGASVQAVVGRPR